MSGKLHPKNLHQGRYDLVALSLTCPELTAFLRPNPKGDQTIDFSDEKAVLCLNKALLAHYYHVQHWQIPPGYLCPPIPGRADYIHYIADLLATGNEKQCPTGKKVHVLDIGTGANCIYPIIGSQSYGWQFVGTDIDPLAVKTAGLIVQSNSALNKLIKVRQQKESACIFKGIIKPKDRFDLTLCNPPFHASMKEAQASSQRKWQNLNKGIKENSSELNFGGQQFELWCPGGELAFLECMVKESVDYAEQICWFTSLVSKKDNIKPLQQILKRLGAKQCEVINMSQGQKVSRLIAWSFLTKADHAQWANMYWH